MKKYVKPEVLGNEDLAEGVYAASGGAAVTADVGSDCYTTTARIHQTPETGRGDYRIQVDAHHDADHNSDKQLLVISFNQDVTYVNGGNGCRGSQTGRTLNIEFSYWNNHTDNIGLGDLIVTSDPGLAITGVQMIDEGKKY